jgi:hypothetical protein
VSQLCGSFGVSTAVITTFNKSFFPRSHFQKKKRKKEKKRKKKPTDENAFPSRQRFFIDDTYFFVWLFVLRIISLPARLPVCLS